MGLVSEIERLNAQACERVCACAHVCASVRTSLRVRVRASVRPRGERACACERESVRARASERESERALMLVQVLSGSDWGNLLLWEGNLIKCEVRRPGGAKCHEGSIEVSARARARATA
eukprot:1744148-Pleurochrysis_carterae.AAC.1